MIVGPKIISLVADFEGFESKPYQDVVGVWTIGYGETKNVTRLTKPISKIQARLLLAKRLNEFGRGVTRLLRRKPTRNQWGAMVSFAYNVGLGAFASSTLLRKFNAGDIRGAADEFLRWNKAGGKVFAGLDRRRHSERAFFLSK